MWREKYIEGRVEETLQQGDGNRWNGWTCWWTCDEHVGMADYRYMSGRCGHCSWWFDQKLWINWLIKQRLDIFTMPYIYHLPWHYHKHYYKLHITLPHFKPMCKNDWKFISDNANSNCDRTLLPIQIQKLEMHFTVDWPFKSLRCHSEIKAISRSLWSTTDTDTTDI